VVCGFLERWSIRGSAALRQAQSPEPCRGGASPFRRLKLWDTPLVRPQSAPAWRARFIRRRRCLRRPRLLPSRDRSDLSDGSLTVEFAHKLPLFLSNVRN
jgi:hypothetical protein